MTAQGVSRLRKAPSCAGRTVDRQPAAPQDAGQVGRRQRTSLLLRLAANDRFLPILAFNGVGLALSARPTRERCPWLESIVLRRSGSWRPPSNRMTGSPYS